MKKLILAVLVLFVICFSGCRSKNTPANDVGKIYCIEGHVYVLAVAMTNLYLIPVFGEDDHAKKCK